MKKCLFFSFVLLIVNQLNAQHEQAYFPETDSLVVAKIEQWRDLKFGLLMHWGPYSQWGVVESWSICGEDEDWCKRKSDSYSRYLEDYENLAKSFNPSYFNPVEWASAAKEAGMKYVVFTTKHHDGFCMFDTRLSEYRITDPSCPFHANQKSNIAWEIFKSFREAGFWTGAYFSKPDWHSEYYWWRYFPTPDRNVNYDIKRYPERWEKFIQYTHGQIMELMRDYGQMDILWLDGGWVRKRDQAEITAGINDAGYKFTREQSQDIRMDELVAKARQAQPGLIVVDRAVPGKNQNYLTPENQVPGKALDYPWESCIISGSSWSWVPAQEYKSARELVHLLVDIVSKGGNLLLNIAPGPDGRWDAGAYSMLSGMGEWMKTNGEAIYGTRSLPPYRLGNTCYTQKRGEKLVYAIYLIDKEELSLPEFIHLQVENPAAISKIHLLGSRAVIDWKINKSGVTIYLDQRLREKLASSPALSFKIQLKE